jgi:hypothetical protein
MIWLISYVEKDRLKREKEWTNKYFFLPSKQCRVLVECALFYIDTIKSRSIFVNSQHIHSYLHSTTNNNQTMRWSLVVILLATVVALDAVVQGGYSNTYNSGPSKQSNYKVGRCKFPPFMQSIFLFLNRRERVISMIISSLREDS